MSWKDKARQARTGGQAAGGGAFLAGKGDDALVAVVDPGTTRLRVLIVELTGGGPVVRGWSEVPGSNEAGVDRLFLVGALDEALEQAETMAGAERGHPARADRMLVGLPGWQLRGWAWPTTQQRSRPDRPVEERELQSLLERSLRLTVGRLCGAESEGWLVVDTVPVTLTVDGHGVTDPVGFRPGQIGATVFVALARLETIQTWQQVAHDLRFARLTLTAAPMALAAGRAEPQGILVDVGGRTTSLTWWQSGRPMALVAMPAGGEVLTHALRRRWGLPVVRAEQLKLAFASGELSGELDGQVEQVLVPAFKSWLSQLERALAQMNEAAERPLPANVCLFGGGSQMPGVHEALSRLAHSRKLTFERYPEVRSLRPADVPGVINRTSLGQLPADVPALALAAWAGGGRDSVDRPARILRDLADQS